MSWDSLPMVIASSRFGSAAHKMQKMNNGFNVGDRVEFITDVGQDSEDKLPVQGDQGVIVSEDQFLAERWHIRWDKGVECHAYEYELKCLGKS